MRGRGGLRRTLRTKGGGQPPTPVSLTLVIFSIDAVGGVLCGVHDGDGRARPQSGRNVADQGGFLSSQAQIGDMRGTCTLENVA